MQTSDIKITASIPFLKARTVLLVDDPNRPILVPTPDFWEKIRCRFEDNDLNFLFIPELLSGITPMIADYLFPGFDVPGVDAVYHRAGIGGRQGLLYKKGGNTWFKDLSAPGTSLPEAIEEILDKLRERIRVCDKQEPSVFFGSKMLAKAAFDMSEEKPRLRKRQLREDEEELDERTKFILSGIQRFLDENNLTLDELRTIIGYRVKLSRMEITRTGKIFLADFPDTLTGKPKEIKMDALTKMLYFFYLRHPEGIRIKDVSGHMDELMHIYMGITGRDDKEAIRASIQGHVAPLGNSINVSMSRIKSAFKNQVDESVARFYWVEGVSGDPYRVAIDRDYVIWEY